MPTVAITGKLLARAAAALLLCHLASAAMACDHPKGWKTSRQELERRQATFDRLIDEASARQKLDQSRDYGFEIPNPSACNADLSGMNLAGFNFANFDLTNTNLEGADLSGATFLGAYMDGANLAGAKAIGANFTSVVMEKATLGGANLENAALWGVRLDGATLYHTNLEGAFLEEVYLTGALYEPRGGPPARISDLEDLESVTFRDSSGVAQLRQLARTTGQRDIERAATFAIEHDITSKQADYRYRLPDNLDEVEGTFRLVAFEWTTGYGLYPGRALQLIVMFLVLLIPLYTWVIWSVRSQQSRAGVYRVRPADRIELAGGKVTVDNQATVERLSLPFRKAIAWGTYFSLLSTFNIGFRDLNVGNWINRTQPTRFQLESLGWVRTVSGLQSLLSLYLLAIWLITYFGRPFD
jgi:hypothetical protein